MAQIPAIQPLLNQTSACDPPVRQQFDQIPTSPRGIFKRTQALLVCTVSRLTAWSHEVLHAARRLFERFERLGPVAGGMDDVESLLPQAGRLDDNDSLEQLVELIELWRSSHVPPVVDSPLKKGGVHESGN